MGRQKHTVEVVKTDLEIHEDLDMQERGWKTQRIGWVVILALVVLAALGLFGDGWASKRTVTQSGTTVEYERFYRQEAIMELKVDLAQAPAGQSVIAFPNRYLEKFNIESIVPEPRENRVEGSQVAYLFEGTPPMKVVFRLTPQQAGSIDGAVRVNNLTIPLTHFIYP